MNWFRHSAPYINAHRGRTFVIYLPGEALAHANFAHTIHDINLLNSLGVKLVLVHGSRPQIQKACAKVSLEGHFHNGLRITDLEQLALVQATVGRQAMQLEARFSMGIANSPMQGSRIRTSRGNFITARPIGVKNGVDFAYTGEVRRVDSEAISTQLVFGADKALATPVVNRLLSYSLVPGIALSTSIKVAGIVGLIYPCILMYYPKPVMLGLQEGTC